MATGTMYLYYHLAESMGQGLIDFSTDTFKMMLATSSYTPSQSSDSQYTDVSGSEVSGTGYTAGGETLTSVSWSRAAGVVTLDADNVAWSSSTFTSRYGAVYDFTSTNKLLIGYIDFGSNQVVAAGTLTITLNASGIFTATIS